MRVGVVGVGVAGSSHLFDLAASDDFEIASVCAARADRAADAATLFGAQAWCTDPADLLADRSVQAVVLATPPHITPALIGCAVAAGLPTLAEKPAAAGAASLRRLIERAGVRGNLARVAYNRRYQRHVAYAAGIIGRWPREVREIRCRWRAPFDARYRSGATYRAGSGFGDGVILDTATHVFDTLLCLGLPALEVVSAQLHAGASGADVAGSLTLTCRSALISVEIGDDGSDSDCWEIEVLARWGYLVLSAGELRGSVRGEEVSVEAGYFHRPVEDLVLLAPGVPHGDMGGAPLGGTLAEALAALEVVEQARARAQRASRQAWLRPRAKALGRLNGAC